MTVKIVVSDTDFDALTIRLNELSKGEISAGQAREKERIKAILAIHADVPISEISKVLNISRQAIWAYKKNWNSFGLTGLEEPNHAYSYSKVLQEHADFIVKEAKSSPHCIRSLLTRLIEYFGLNKGHSPYSRKQISLVLTKANLVYKRTGYTLKKSATKLT